MSLDELEWFESGPFALTVPMLVNSLGLEDEVCASLVSRALSTLLGPRLGLGERYRLQYGSWLRYVRLGSKAEALGDSPGPVSLERIGLFANQFLYLEADDGSSLASVHSLAGSALLCLLGQDRDRVLGLDSCNPRTNQPDAARRHELGALAYPVHQRHPDDIPWTEIDGGLSRTPERDRNRLELTGGSLAFLSEWHGWLAHRLEQPQLRALARRRCVGLALRDADLRLLAEVILQVEDDVVEAPSPPAVTTAPQPPPEPRSKPRTREDREGAILVFLMSCGNVTLTASLSEISSETGIPRSTVHDIVSEPRNEQLKAVVDLRKRTLDEQQMQAKESAVLPWDQSGGSS